MSVGLSQGLVVERRGENHFFEFERVHARMGRFLEDGIFEEF